MAVLGTVITTSEGPSVSRFSFVVNTKVKRGQFVSIQTTEGLMLGTISDIYKTNKYFESAGVVQEYSKDTSLFAAFPVKDWEYTIADAKLLGVYNKEGLLERPSFPPSPGSEVTEVELNVLNRFLGLDQENGLHLGSIQQHKLAAKFNLTRMIQKHLAILAISGAGKSYATAVLLEELLNRQSKQGRIAVLVIDNHGEYVSFAGDPAFKEKVQVIDANNVKINVASMNERGFAALSPGMSAVQIRELGRILKEVRAKAKEKGKSYGPEDIMDCIKNDEQITRATKDALIGWLADIESLNVFSTADYPNISNLLQQGKMVIINFRDIFELRKKQLIVNYLSRKLFDLRKSGACPPYLEIIEEAHNFCPEGARAEYALSRRIIETLAREGRKFYANICLISQRPIQLSTTALSQCNTQIIFKVTNPYDLDHIRKSAEAITSSTLDTISSLKVGEALVIGEATNYPVFIKVRKRRSKEQHGLNLEKYAKNYEQEASTNIVKGEEFL